jgi:hypothetical protein
MKRNIVILFVVLVFIIVGLLLHKAGRWALRQSQIDFAYGVVIETSGFCYTHQRLPFSYEELHNYNKHTYRNADHLLVLKWGTPVKDAKESTKLVIVTSPLIRDIEPALNELLWYDIKEMRR